MLVRELKEQFHNELDVDYGKEEVANFFFMLLEHYYGLKRIDLAVDINKEIASEKISKIISALGQLKVQKPIQYIIGETEFYGLPFKVNNNVLIPRPETEDLVNWVVEDFTLRATQKPVRIIDIGTGSGCIAISLAKALPKAKVYALDVSKKAISLAKENADLNNVEVTFIEADILKTSALLGLSKYLENPDFKFDVIVSNPPYVRYLEKAMMKPNVLENEPHLALFVKDDDPLLFYRVITEFAVNNLKSQGQLFYEINEYLGNQMKRLLEDFPFNSVEVKQDIFSKDRMLKAVLNH